MAPGPRLALLALVLLGCEGSPAPPPVASGGSGNGAGGAPATGGSADGGTTQTASGGAAPSGGQTGSGGTATGGAASGGTASGGVASGGSAAGGSGGQTEDPSCEAGVHAGQTPAHLTLSGNTFAHDPTMIRIGDTYYRFWTGDYVPMATSTNLTHWSNAASAYGASYPGWVDDWLAEVPDETFNFPWAPDVSVFSGQVHLYSSFSAKFGDNISCISHLSTPDADATPFVDHGPVICSEGSENHNAIDADVGFDESGAPWLAFGSFWDGIMLMPLNADGSAGAGDLANIARSSEIEAPVLFRRCGYYYLMVSWGLCCPGEGRSVDDLSYRVVVGRAADIAGPYLDRAGTPMTDGGGTLVVEGDGVTWAAAGHGDVLFDGGRVYHLYHAYRQANGAAELRIAELFFDQEGWPVPHAP